MQPSVTVVVRYFAGMREAVGCAEEAVELPAETSDQDILAYLARRHPAIGAWCRVSRVAVGDTFIRGAVQLDPHSDVAIIPPVSGG